MLKVGDRIDQRYIVTRRLRSRRWFGRPQLWVLYDKETGFEKIYRWQEIREKFSSRQQA